MSDYLFFNIFKITANPKSMKNPERKNPQYIPRLPEHMLLNISETILTYRKINPIINRIRAIPIILISYQLLKFILVKRINRYPTKSFTKHLNHMGRHLFNPEFVLVNTFRDASRYLSIRGVM